MTDAVAVRAPPLEAEGADFAGRLCLAWMALAVVLGLLALARVLAGWGGTIAEYFLFDQDLVVLCLATVALFGAALGPARFSAAQSARVADFVRRRALVLTLAAAAIVAGVALAGWYVVCLQYPLSMDEFWATFDAHSIRRLSLTAQVPPEWRPYAFALQPNLRADLQQHSVLVSTYLPMNATLRAALGPLSGPVCAAASIVLVYALARRYWPDRPDAAFVSAALLATSSQLVVTAMTPYAMSAHLALNLAWLWFLGGKSWRAQNAAVATAFVAMGLHQYIFHPLFAAPFVLQLWLERRWSRAAFHTIAYAGLGLFWSSYWPIALGALGLSPAIHGQQAASGAQSAIALLSAVQPFSSLGLMTLNLLRFVAWQNPLAVALALVAIPLGWRKSPALPLLAGIVLTTGAMAVLLPFQGHGWGYRYLHGLLGNLCLMAGFAWTALPTPEPVARRAWMALALCLGFAVLVALPIRAYQVTNFERPYAQASAAIHVAPADVVLVDPASVWYGQDLVRNDPSFAGRPKVMDLMALDDAQISDLCARYKVAVFDVHDAARFGVTTYSGAPIAQEVEARRLLEALRCGTSHA